MDYNSVTAFAYISATALSLLLTLFLAHASALEHWKWPIAAGATIQTLWLGLLSYSLVDTRVSTAWLLVLEATHFVAWIGGLSLSLYLLRPNRWPQRLIIALLIAVLVYLVAVTDTVLGLTSSTALLFFCFLVLAFLALVCLEQLVRNAQTGRFIKLLGISLALLFLFNVYLYAQGLINRRVDVLLWEARAALLMAVSFLIVSAGLLFKDTPNEPSRLELSRPVAFYSTSLLISSVAVLLLAVGGYYVRTLGGHWGIYLFTLLLFGSLVALSALFFSDHVRSAIQVWVSKHFFRHKYDYRQEWLNVIQALSTVTEASKVYERIYQVIATTFKATGGVVMALQGEHYHKVYSQNSGATRHPNTVSAYAAFISVMIEEDWVFAPQEKEGALAEYNDILPDWIRQDPAIQLVVPLVTQNQLIGFVALEKADGSVTPGWEDLDILKTVGRQLANHVLIHTQEEELSQARQLDTYNKLSAFIMHDLNNLIAQLALVVKNSERHKSNPAFIDDMILTVSNAANRMTGLMQKFSRSEQEVVGNVSVFGAVEASIEACNATLPKPTLSIKGDDRNIQADKERFILAIKHLVKNAQEATPDDGQVEVDVQSHPSGPLIITIADSGAGMSQAFIEQQLFKPFETTKTGQGMGIGVYLTRSYLEELGASLEVTSQVGNGTTFTVTFSSGME